MIKSGPVCAKVTKLYDGLVVKLAIPVMAASVNILEI